MATKIELAKQYRERGYGCAQPVLATFSQDYGLGEEASLRISTGFGSGMGRMCKVCGALTGAFMVIGLRHGSVATDGTNKETTYRLVADLAKKFEENNGSIHCRELTGNDLSDSEERAKVIQMGLSTTICRKLILESVMLLEEML